ncbi:MAG: Signal peptidase-like protein [Verrucomicrobia bacterium]|nr:Signal peptidase-like protein [Cytophagales bacterium]
MSVFDWLSDMDTSDFNIIEIRFKSGRKEFFRNTENLPLNTGDPVIVDVPNGHHLGTVSMQGELVRLQMRRKSITETHEDIKHIYRIATEKDLEKYEQSKAREMPTLFRTRQIIGELKLTMKLSDVEFQADNSKATFYYSAEERVDFRELIKMLAGEFKIRVEMKQISLRQEAGRLGGVGVCGRELCCSTWIHDFKTVSTAAARYQNLSLNPSKLSGQCGRLKCCLNYELDTYIEALKDIPTVEEPLLTEKGRAFLQKTDIFKKIMWFGFNDANNWIPLDLQRVTEVLAMNKLGKKPFSLEYNQDPITEAEKNQAKNSDLEQYDKKFANVDKKKKNNRKFFDKKKDNK